MSLNSLSIYALTPPRRESRRPTPAPPEAPRPARSALSAVLSPDSALKSTPFPISEPKSRKTQRSAPPGIPVPGARAIPWTWVRFVHSPLLLWYGSPASSR